VEAYKESPIIYSQKVKAGKRTYFFDVKTTRANDYFLIITESKKQFNDEGPRFQKHKIFLYKEDLNKFLAAMEATVAHIKEELLPDYDFDEYSRQAEDEEIL
jgi:hypothetical protein